MLALLLTACELSSGARDEDDGSNAYEVDLKWFTEEVSCIQGVTEWYAPDVHFLSLTFSVIGTDTSGQPIAVTQSLPPTTEGVFDYAIARGELNVIPCPDIGNDPDRAQITWAIER